MIGKKTALAALLFVLCTATTAEASEDAIRAEIFKDARLIVNNVPVQAREGDPPVLNVEGRTYVPLRKISEYLGGVASYDPADRSVYVDNVPHPPSGIPEVKAAASNEEFTIRLFSQKSVYAEGEPISVWARLTREKDEPITVYHGTALALIHLKDEDGFSDVTLAGLSLETSTFNKNDEYNISLHPLAIFSYKAYKMGGDWEEYMNNGIRPTVLPKGIYSITADAYYSLDKKFVAESTRDLQASIEITVE
ncbi:stalk domain-containing protein [Cohnella sp. GCM10027633]|uniref:stalk domain-containing protein n=1 Tax=unclassified Cohnella TaxID=2636738 RepID=UPI003628845C